MVDGGGTKFWELLLGVNDDIAAKALFLKYEKFNNNSTEPQMDAFKNWMKNKIDTGIPVVAGFYVRGFKDPDYDVFYYCSLKIYYCSI